MSDSSAEKPLLAGRYRLGKRIGRGGMADVFRAMDTRLSRPVAIKLLKPEFAKDEAFVARFTQEARASSRLTHPGIVKVYDAGQDRLTLADGTSVAIPYIVMERVEGLDLSQLLSRGPLKPEEASRITSEILDALEYAHRTGIVHRDIKPGNIMLTANGSVKLLDFGIAHAVEDSAEDVTQALDILGTATYFSPEQARGERVDARTDLYAVGLVYFEMLTGQPVFSGTSPVAVANRHLHEQIPDPTLINPKITPGVAVVIRRSLEKNRDARYQTAGEFQAALTTAKTGQVPAQPVHTDPVAAIFGDNTLPTGSLAAPADDDLAAMFPNAELNTAPFATIENLAPKQRGRVIAGLLATIVVVIAIAMVTLWVINIKPVDFFPQSSRVVPDVTGWSYTRALDKIREAGLEADRIDDSSDTIQKDVVISTEPKAGTKLDVGVNVKVHVSIGAKLVDVPDLAGMTVADATTTLTDLGLKLGAQAEVTSGLYGAGLIVSSTPAAGSGQVKSGTVINVNVANGKVDVPDVRGKSIQEATTMLQAPAVGLSPTVNGDKSCPAQSGLPVTAQSLKPGQQPQGSAIQLTYCSG